MGNALRKLGPSLLQEITASPNQAFGSPPQRCRLDEGEGLEVGDRVIPAEFPRQRLSSEVILSDFGLLLQVDKTAVENKFRGAPGFIAPERCHGSDPSQASDLWGFTTVFVYLYLGSHPFPGGQGHVSGDTIRQLLNTRDHLGPLPARWATLGVDLGISKKDKKALYAPQGEMDLGDPPASKFAGRLRDDWQKRVAARLNTARKDSADGKQLSNPRSVEWFEHELRAKEEAEPHALKVIHSIFRYQPEQRLSAERLLGDSDWLQLMKACGV